MAFIDPTAEQFEVFAGASIEGPIHMLNMLKFKKNGGRESYMKYGENTRPLLEKAGAKIIYEGAPKATVIGGEEWDSIFIVEYPSRQAFFDMVSSDEYRQGVHHRTEALEDSRLICMKPVDR